MNFWQERPYLTATLSGLLCTFMTAIGVVAAQMMGLHDQAEYMLMAAAIAVSAVLGILIMRVSRFTLSDYGFNRNTAQNANKVWFYMPLILIELTAIAATGFSGEISASLLAAIALLTIAVGFNEEIFFRGLALKLLCEKGAKKAIVSSSVLFGTLHIANAFNGRAWPSVVLQIAFAFLVGIVLAELVSITKNLWLVIVWHISHDFIAVTTGSASAATESIVLAIQVAILLVYAIGLWKKATDDKAWVRCETTLDA